MEGICSDGGVSSGAEWLRSCSSVCETWWAFLRSPKSYVLFTLDWSLWKRLSVTSNVRWIWPHVARGHPHAACCGAGGVSPLQLCRERAAPRLLRLPPDDQVSVLVSWLNKVNRRYHLELSHTRAACNRELSVPGPTWDGAMVLLPLGVIRGQTLCQLGFISGYAVSFSSLSLFLSHL